MPHALSWLVSRPYLRPAVGWADFASKQLLLLSLAHFSSWTKFLQTEYSCIQALWQRLSMPGKHWLLESRNSIVSTYPRDPAFTITSLASMGPEDTAQLPVEGAKGIEKLAPPCQKGTLCGLRIRGHDPAYLGLCYWAKRQRFICLDARIGPLGEAEKETFNTARDLRPLSWVRGRIFWLVMSCLLCNNPLWGD